MKNKYYVPAWKCVRGEYDIEATSKKEAERIAQRRIDDGENFDEVKEIMDFGIDEAIKLTGVYI